MTSIERVSHSPYVCIIESPSGEDVSEDRSEGEALSLALKLGDVQHTYYSVANLETLKPCFAKMADDTAITIKDGIPHFPMLYIHFSAHGNDEGIGLTDGDFVAWSALGDLLIQFAERADRIFPEVPACIQTICFSVCEGLNGAKMTVGRPICPFYGLIGPPHPVYWSDSLTAFVAFYHNVCHKGSLIVEGVTRMNAAIGEDLFIPVVCSQFGYDDSFFEK